MPQQLSSGLSHRLALGIPLNFTYSSSHMVIFFPLVQTTILVNNEVYHLLDLFMLQLELNHQSLSLEVLFWKTTI